MGFKAPPGMPPKKALWSGMIRPNKLQSPLVANLMSKKRLSRSQLHKILIIMLAVVFCVYVFVMVVLVGRTHTMDIEQQHSAWGPPIEESNQIVKDHLESLAKRREIQKPKKHLLKGTNSVPPPVKPKDVSINAQAMMKGASKDMEQVEIIHMKKPDQVIDIDIKKPELVKKQPPRTTPKAASAQTTTGKTRTLRAYLEPIYLNDWEKKPLPLRNITANQLTKIEYPRVNSCQRLTEQFPIDDYPDADPFLPWIHDVYPTEDGKLIQFIAQNKRRCRTGTTPEEATILEHMQPQIALFQHVPVKRISKNKNRYQLTTHEQADPDGIETRFICQFQPSGQETLSVYNVQYDYASFRKRFKKTFSKDGNSKVGKDNKHVHTSQLIFQCPVPPNLVNIIRDGSSVVDDKPSLFVNVIPIRTPPRYGAPNRFLPPYYQDQNRNNFSVAEEWGEAHILPKIQDSGRWENIPICQPTTIAYPESTVVTAKVANSRARVAGAAPKVKSDVTTATNTTKPHRLIACTWATTGYATRGDRFSISDGSRRLDEWIRFHLLVGVEHLYIYDNSPEDSSLKPVTDQFPGQVTRVPWPATICNNNHNYEDSPGERSSQYAAESSCRLRFGPQSDWLANMDIDEYIVPVGNYTSLQQLLNELDQAGTKIISFGSWRSWPRYDLIEPPIPIQNKTVCDLTAPCFHLKIPIDKTILRTYNCDRHKDKQDGMPAEKQIFRTDYVLQHYVHYSTITALSQMNREETEKAGFNFNKIVPDPQSRFSNEETEVTMLHTKAIATQDTAGWQNRCSGKGACRLGYAFPKEAVGNVTKDADGWLYNCMVNQKIEQYWVPRLEESMKDSIVRNEGG